LKIKILLKRRLLYSVELLIIEVVAVEQEVILFGRLKHYSVSRLGLWKKNLKNCNQIMFLQKTASQGGFLSPSSKI